MLTLVLLLSAPLPAATVRFCYEGDLQNTRLQSQQVGPYQIYGDVAGRLAEAVQQLQIQAVFHKMPWRRCLKAVADGTLDAAFALAWTIDRANKLVFPPGLPHTQPHPLRMNRISYVIYRKKGGLLQWDGQQFAQVRHGVAAPQGYAAEKQLAALGVLNPVNLDTGSALKLVANDRLDAFVFPQSTASSVLANHPDASRLEALPEYFSETDVFLVFNPAFAQRQHALVQALWHHSKLPPTTDDSAGHTQMLAHPLSQTKPGL